MSSKNRRKKSPVSPRSRPGFKRILVGVIIVFLLFVFVHMGRKTEWGMVMAAGRQKTKGNIRASVVIMEFSDFQCPACKNAQEPLKNLLLKYPKQVKLVFKHYPLPMHRWAKAASVAAECSKEQGKFWAYHDTLFENQDEWTKSDDAKRDFLLYARELDLEMEKFDRCYNSQKILRHVDKDVAEGEARGVRSTPTFFINDHKIVGGGQLFRNGARLIQVELPD